MHILGEILEILDTGMPTPTMYGWFHLLWLALTVLAAVWLCVRFKEGTERQARWIIFITAIIVTVLEIYKQINYTFTYTGETIAVDYQWYSFPWQFCSMPMYVGLLAGVTKKGKLHDALCAFLATHAIFAGVCVMVYPADVFTRPIGVNIQTMICHGSMIAIGVYLLYTGYVKVEHKTILKATPVFCTALAIALIGNEIACRTGLLETETFNMFFVSPYCEPSLPVYSSVQRAVAYPWSLIIYIAAFSLAAYLILLMAIAVKAIAKRIAAK